MNEDYKICPYCNNAVDKKDKQCPYCLKSLTWRNTSSVQIDNNTTNSENIDRDSGIKDNSAGNNFEIPPLFKRLLEAQKVKIGGIKTTNDPEAIKKARKFIIIFFIIMRGIPFLIGIITSIFGE